jgi:hypothetical protein
MKPIIGKGAGNYKPQEEKPPSKARLFVELNTHHSICMKRKFMYVEDVKTAMNINTLEERISLKRWLLNQLESHKSKEELIQLLANLAGNERHLLQKRFKISI